MAAEAEGGDGDVKEKWTSTDCVELAFPLGRVGRSGEEHTTLRSKPGTIAHLKNVKLLDRDEDWAGDRTINETSGNC